MRKREIKKSFSLNVVTQNLIDNAGNICSCRIVPVWLYCRPASVEGSVTCYIQLHRGFGCLLNAIQSI